MAGNSLLKIIPNEINIMTSTGVKSRRDSVIKRIKGLINRSETIIKDHSDSRKVNELNTHIEFLRGLLNYSKDDCRTQWEFQKLEARVNGVGASISQVDFALANGGKVELETIFR